MSSTSLWVPETVQRYVPLLDHGPRAETRGVVLHVNAGFWSGTENFFSNGERYPYGSEGVGAHFEIGGRGLNGKPSNSIYADHGCVQFVPLDRVTWHAVEANGFAIGVEHAGWGRSRDEWLKLHYNLIGNSAYRVAWIHHRFGLGPPVVSRDDPGKGTVWPHSCGGEAWGGHGECPGEFFPWDIWEPWCQKAYKERWMWD